MRGGPELKLEIVAAVMVGGSDLAMGLIATGAAKPQPRGRAKSHLVS